MKCLQSKFKDKCDACGQFSYLKGVDNKCLCSDCIKARKEETMEIDFFKSIKEHIQYKYGIEVEQISDSIYDYQLLIKSKKYDLTIALEQADDRHYLFNKYKYVLYFDYNANKKYRNELNWHGGGYSDGFTQNDYSNIDNFLNDFIEVKNNKSQMQLSIFDINYEN